MKIYAAVPTDDDQPGAGPFTDRSVADIALKILQMTIDPNAEIIECELDEHADQIKAGLKPWLISINLENGRVIGKPTMKLHWPPMEEGIVFENPGLRECFVWARSMNDAILKLPRLKRIVNPNQDMVIAEAGG